MGCCCNKKRKYEVDDLAIDTSVFKIREGNFKDVYLIGSLIGEGALGEVRKCKLKHSEVVRAVRILRKNTMGDLEGY